mgnify:CR=1 FL=1
MLVHSIDEATIEDAISMSHNMRDVDKDEVWATSMSSPLEALTKSVKSSEQARTGRVNGEIVCMFGVCRQNLLGMRGSVWLLGTDLLKKNAIRFLRETKQEVMDLSQNFIIIENYCDSRNKITLRWLKWLGFTIERARPYGVYDLPFHHFYKEGDPCVNYLQ